MGFDFWPNSIIPVAGNPEYPLPSPPPPLPPSTGMQLCAIELGTIYIPIQQVYTSAVKDTADWLVEHRKLTLPLRPRKIVSHFSFCFLVPISYPDLLSTSVTADKKTGSYFFWHCLNLMSRSDIGGNNKITLKLKRT